MKSSSFPFAAGAALLLAFPPSLPSAETDFAPSLQFSTGIAGGQNKLTWPAQPGARYRIKSSTGLPEGAEGPGGWRTRAIVEPDSTNGSWLDPEPAGPRAFYQVEPPGAEVFSVEPAVVSPGAGLVITGQCLPAGSSVVFEIEGIPPVMAPIITGPDGRMTATLPAFDIITQPGSGLGPQVKRATVVGPDGSTVCVIGQTFEVTTSGFATFAPPFPPPAVPLGMAINEKGLPGEKKPKGYKTKMPARMAGGGGESDEDCDEPEISGAMLLPALMKAKEKANKMASARPKTSECENSIGGIARFGRPAVNTALNHRVLPGEVSLQQCDLALAVPAGPPLAFVRTYSSMNQPSSACGTGWDHSYNVFITPIYDSTTDPAPTRVAVHTGDGRVEVMHRQGAVYVCDGAFRTGVLNPDTSFTLTFADQSRIIFCPLVGAPWQGRVGSVVDRNGVALTCTYTAGGHLNTVTSQFGQSLTFTHDTSGHVTKVEDQTGRFVSLAYFGAGEPGGNEGDLKSVSCPIVPGQAPVRGPETFTYSTGSPDPRLNSNVLTCVDGAGRLQAGFIYATAPASSPSYDRVVACDRFSTDPADPVMHFSYEFIPGSGGGAGGLLYISNDEMGRVMEVECSRTHDPLRIRNYTTFATPGIPVTSTTNRPPASTEPGEPAFLETTFAWNPDHLCTRCTEPDGLQTRVTYDRELRKDCPQRERGNARVVTFVSPDDSEPPRTVSMEYLTGFGTSEGKKGLNAVNVSLARSSSAGTRVRKGMQDIKNYRSGYGGGEDGDGGSTDSVCGNPIGGLTIKGGRNPGGNIAGRAAGGGDDDCDGPDDDWSGASNPIPGVGIVVKRNPGSSTARPGSPIGGLSIKGGRNPGGNSVARKGGNVEWMDDWEMPESACTRLTTTTGQVFTWSYDTHGNCVSSTTPIPGSGAVCTWNSLGQLTSVTVLNGPGSRFPGLRQYDPVTHYLIGDTVDPDVNGTGEGLSLTTTCVRNALGLVTSATNPRGQTTQFSYNACDQLVSVTSPPLGHDPLTAQSVTCTQFYDRGGLPVRCDLEHRDATGALVTTNPHYTGFCVYNSRGLLVMDATEQKPVDVPPAVFDPVMLGLENFDAVVYTPNAAGDCVRVTRPAECRNQTASEQCDIGIDALGRVSTITTGGLGTPGAITTEYHYNRSSQVTSASLALPAGTLRPTVTYTFDAWRRPSTFTDEVGTVTSWSYSNNGFVTEEVHGKEGDVGGTGPNVLLARRRGQCDYGDVIVAKTLDSSSTALRLSVGGGDCDDGDDDPSPLGMAINEKGLPGEKGTKKPKSHARTAGGSPFFDVFTTDVVCTAERFAPGAPAPHEAETTTVHYSPAGLPLSVSRNGDLLCTFGHDTAGRTIVTANPAVLTRTCTLDACGNVISSTVTAHSSIPGTPAETFTTATTFDQLNRWTSHTDSVGNTHTRALDSLGRPVSETQPGGLTVTYAYDAVSSTGTFSSCTVSSDYNQDGITDHFVSSTTLGGICSSTTDALGYTTSLTTDSQSRPTRVDFPDKTFETWSYNPLGQCASHVRKSGYVVAADYNYKAQSTRVIVSNLPPGTVAVPPTEYVWNGLGHCVQVTEGASIVLRGYDSFGNCVTESQNGHTVTHTYNHRGCTGTTYPGGERFNEVRNAQGQLLSFSAVNSAGVTLTPPITQCEYLGYVTMLTISRNGVQTTHDFRSDGEPPLPLGGDAVEDFTFGGCVRTTVTGPGGNVLENHIIRRNADQCETQHHRVFGEASASPSRRMTFTLDQRNLVTRCVTQVRLTAGTPVVDESDVSYELDARGQRIRTIGGSNPGLYTSSDASPLFDRQMGQYSSWPGGSLVWRDDGDLSFLGRPGGGLTLIYDAWSRLVEVLDANGAPVAGYAYDACSRRISSTLPGTAGLPPATTFFLYDGPTCFQELQDGGGVLVPEMTFGVAGGIKHCIITKNGSTYYPNGGGSSDNGTAIVFPYIPAEPNRLELIPENDDIRMECLTVSGGGDISYVGPCDADDCTMLTTSTGAPFERFASSDSCEPIFLNSDGLPTGAASSAIGYRYMLCYTVNSAWCPETGLIQCPGGVYSPELGQPISSHKTKPKEKEKEVVHKKEYVGHVTLLK